MDDYEFIESPGKPTQKEIEFVTAILEEIQDYFPDEYVKKTKSDGTVEWVLVEKNKCDVCRWDETKRTALQIATKYGWLEEMANLLKRDEYQLDTMNPNKYGHLESAAHVAVKYSQLEALQFLISKGADMNVGCISNPFNHSILFLASKHPDKVYFNTVLKAGARLYLMQGGVSGFTLQKQFLSRS
ncbi:hypothetical protein CHUAL_006206 [Chamberlinius hualienensis]